jgi:hypothetical protein
MHIFDTHRRDSIDPQRRRDLIAEAAYFIAQARGFEPGHELIDWLAAEDQVDSALLLADMLAAALLKQQEH